MSVLRRSRFSVRILVIVAIACGFLLYVMDLRLHIYSANGDRNSSTEKLHTTLQISPNFDQKGDHLSGNIMNRYQSDQTTQKLQNFLEPLREPTMEYEQLRRRMRSNVLDAWNFFNTELYNIQKQKPDLSKQIQKALQMGMEHKRSILHNINRLASVDSYEDWRFQEAQNLSDLVQRRLHYLQNPQDCKNARKLVCQLNKRCGFGCQLHHVVYCFIVAYATERTVILNSKRWQYHTGGWEDVFQPISSTCMNVGRVHGQVWPAHPDAQVLLLPIVDVLNSRPPYLPPAIPEDLAPRLKKLHGDPIVWWVGQFLKYLVKPQHLLKEMLEGRMIELGWKKPIVGIHVRRTDKLYIEAAFHSLEEYMTHVEDYFLTMEISGRSLDRRIFIASDDASVLTEAKEKYPNYEIMAYPDTAKTAGVLTRYTDSSLHGIILDIYSLSLCDYLVCTFSSQVCRVAYEIMQTMYPDAAHRFKSLDEIYYFGGQNPHNHKAVVGHSPGNQDEISLKPGDLVTVEGNHGNGLSKGTNLRTMERGVFPSFKVVDQVETVKLPTYPEA